MAKQIKVGVITHAGGAHLNAYFPALSQAKEVESVVLADPDGRWEASAKKTLGNKLTAVYKARIEMLDKEQPAMALVTMEAKSTPPAIAEALEAGCHVFAEKPACVKLADFEKLADIADSKHRYLMLALANRLNPEIQTARKLLQSKTLGTIYGLEMHLVADQTRLTRPAYHKQWFAKKARAGGGFLTWLGIHWIDLAMYITNSKIIDVAGFVGNVGGQPIDVEDSAAVSMRFDNGTFGTLTSGYYLDKGYHSHIKIWGSHGWMLLEPFTGEALQWYSRKETKSPKVEIYNGPKDPRGYSPFVRAAVRAAADLDEPPITTAESLHVLRTVFGIYKASETGQTQSLRS